MAIKWKNGDENILKANIYDGAIVATIVALFPKRTERAIIQRAQALGYGVKTEDNSMKFYDNINRRYGRSNKVKIVGEPRVTTNNFTPTIASETINTESDDIVSDIALNKEYKGLKAYANAMDMLSGNNLPLEHDMICMLSTYILKHTRAEAC